MPTGQLPKFVAEYWRARKWAELVFFFQKMWDRDASLCLKRNRNAVNRIKQEFERLTGCKVYEGVWWHEQIAKYIDKLGVAVLIDDMRQAVAKAKINKKKIISIAYFLCNRTFGPNRWENLVMQKLYAESEQEKRDLNAPVQNKQVNDLLNKMALPDMPEEEWAQKTRERYRYLDNILSGGDIMGVDLEMITREIRKIEDLFQRQGLEL